MTANPHAFPTRATFGTLSLLLLASTIGGCGSSTKPEAATDAAPTVLVQTMQPRRQSLSETLTLFGEMAQDVGASENVSFARPVLISRLLVGAGQRVRAGQPLLEVVTDPNAAATFQQAKSAVTLAQRELKSQQELFTERLTTQAQLAAARKALADADAALTAQRELGAAPGTQTVRASHDAVVATLSAQQGDRVQPGTAVLQLSKAGAQRALLGAEPEDVARLAPGMAVQLIPVFGGAAVPATISQVLAVINPQTRLVDIGVHTMGASSQLMSGLKVRGDIILKVSDAWVVPHSAVLNDAHGAYVFQVAGGHAKRVPVRVSIENPKLDGVVGAIDPKLPIVISGNYELEDGAAVRASAQ
jgi:membrane fusion protein (multidrug efflux system)